MEDRITDLVNERYLRTSDVPLAQVRVHDGPTVIRKSLFCPHLDKDNCACRKPKPGMIWSLAVEYDIDLSRSWIIGDSHSDIKAGYRAGIRRMIRIDHDVDPVTPDPGEVVKLPKKLSDVVTVPNLLNAVGYMQAYDSYIQRVWGPRK